MHRLLPLINETMEKAGAANCSTDKFHKTKAMMYNVRQSSFSFELMVKLGNSAR